MGKEQQKKPEPKYSDRDKPADWEKKAPKVFYLRVKPSHPNGFYRIQEHKIGKTIGEFELDGLEQKELASKGGQSWVQECSKEQYEIEKKEKAKRSKLVKDLDKMDV